MSVPSPCISVCLLDPATGWCTGCGRTIQEIAAWGSLDDAGKRAIWALLPDRRVRLASAAAAPSASPSSPAPTLGGGRR